MYDRVRYAPHRPLPGLWPLRVQGRFAAFTCLICQATVHWSSARQTGRAPKKKITQIVGTTVGPSAPPINAAKLGKKKKKKKKITQIIGTTVRPSAPPINAAKLGKKKTKKKKKKKKKKTPNFSSRPQTKKDLFFGFFGTRPPTCQPAHPPGISSSAWTRSPLSRRVCITVFDTLHTGRCAAWRLLCGLWPLRGQSRWAAEGRFDAEGHFAAFG